MHSNLRTRISSRDGHSNLVKTMKYDFVFPLSQAIFGLVIFLLGLSRYAKTKDSFIKKWSYAFLFFGLANLLSTLTIARLFSYSNSYEFIFLQFSRQTFISLFFVIILYGLLEETTLKYDYRRNVAVSLFIFSELILLYHDLALKGAVGENIHIIIFDIPFNLGIGFLFMKQYFSKRDAFNLLNGIAWLGYVITVILNQNIASFTQYAYVIYTISEVPLFLIMISMISLYHTKDRMPVIDLKDVFAIEAKGNPDALLEEYSINYGQIVLFNDISKKTFDYASKFIEQNMPALILTRQNPDYLRNKYGFKAETKIYWLTKVKTHYDTIDPSNIENVIYMLNEFIKTSINNDRKSIIVIDGMEYLVLNTSFIKTMHSFQLIKDYASSSKTLILVPIIDTIFSEKELGMLRQEFSIVDM